MYAQYGAVMSTIAVEIVVFTVVVNFFMTIRGKTDMLRTNIALRWFYTGAVYYVITCFQCAFHTTLTLQKLIHFSDWVPGHAHLVMLGVFGFWLLGMVEYLWPRLVGNTMYSRKLSSAAYWLATGGTFVMFLDLLVAGVAQGYLWMNLAQWEKSLILSAPFWHLRTLAGSAIICGILLYGYNMWMTAKNPGTRQVEDGSESIPDEKPEGAPSAARSGSN